jgi:hypothetical protein
MDAFPRLTDQVVPGAHPSSQSRRIECCFPEDKEAEEKMTAYLHPVTSFRTRSFIKQYSLILSGPDYLGFVIMKSFINNAKITVRSGLFLRAKSRP